MQYSSACCHRLIAIDFLQVPVVVESKLSFPVCLSLSAAAGCMAQLKPLMPDATANAASRVGMQNFEVVMELDGPAVALGGEDARTGAITHVAEDLAYLQRIFEQSVHARCKSREESSIWHKNFQSCLNAVVECRGRNVDAFLHMNLAAFQKDPEALEVQVIILGRPRMTSAS